MGDLAPAHEIHPTQLQPQPHFDPRPGELPDLVAQRPRHALQPQKLCPPSDNAQGLLQMAIRHQRHRPRSGRAHSPTSRSATPLPTILYDNEVERLLRYTRDLLWARKPDPRPYVLISLILQTAIKKSECMGIKLEHIDGTDPRAPILYIRYPNARMRHKERKLILAPQFLPSMRQYIAQYKPETTPVRMHRPQPGIRPDRCRQSGGHRAQIGVVRGHALDRRSARLSHRHGARTAAQEAGPVQDQLAGNRSEDTPVGIAGRLVRPPSATLPFTSLPAGVRLSAPSDRAARRTLPTSSPSSTSGRVWQPLGLPR